MTNRNDNEDQKLVMSVVNHYRDIHRRDIIRMSATYFITGEYWCYRLSSSNLNIDPTPEKFEYMHRTGDGYFSRNKRDRSVYINAKNIEEHLGLSGSEKDVE